MSKNNKSKSQGAKKESFELDPQLIEDVRAIIKRAQKQTARKVSSGKTYKKPDLGKNIIEEEQDGQNSTYLFDELVKELSENLMRNIDARELRRFRQFYLYFPRREAVRPELSWSHYRLLLHIENKSEREFYLEKAISERWSARELEQNIKNQYYDKW